jgi:hypothetical protein
MAAIPEEEWQFVESERAGRARKFSEDGRRDLLIGFVVGFGIIIFCIIMWGWKFTLAEIIALIMICYGAVEEVRWCWIIGLIIFIGSIAALFL